MMKSKRMMLLVVMTLCLHVSVKAQWGNNYYFTQNQLPNLINILPEPPEATSEMMAHDIMRYYWGKEQRLDEERVATARRQAVLTFDAMYNEFSEPFGMTISSSNTPQLCILLEKALPTADQICNNIKSHYSRRRPFDLLNEKLLTDGKEESASSLKKNGSYPSGHTNRGWVCALILAEVNPDNAEAIFSCGYAYGESRVIVGAHWQSDVEAGRLAGSIAYSRLQTSSAFREQMEKAKEEFKQKTQPTNVGAVTESSLSASDRTYNVNGMATTDQSRGVVIRNNQKMIRK